MKKFVKPEKYRNIPDLKTLKDIILYGTEKGGDSKQFEFNNLDNELESKSFNQVFHDVKGLGQNLYRLGLRGKKVAILSENSYYWIACYYSIISGKITAIPLDPKLPDDDLIDLMIRSKCDAIYYTNEFQTTIDKMKSEDDIVITEYLPIEDFYSHIENGYNDLESGANDFLDDEVLPDDLAFIVFTSGTTGKSKGVMLSQYNVASNAVASCRASSGGQAIGFLPLHHCFCWIGALFAGYLFAEWGYICKNIGDIQKGMTNFHPQNFSAVPLAVETVYKRIWFNATKGGNKEKLEKGLKISRFLMRLGIDKRRKIFKQVIDGLGGNLEVIICGGAYLDTEYERGMYDFGVQVINGYGITECSPAVTCNRLDNFKFGSAGLPLECNEIKINEPDEDGVGEIYIRGTNIMQGYFDDPEATAEAFDDGWFKSGDYGFIDEDGFLFFKGRKKNLIVLSNGKNVSPEEIEDKLSTISYVKEVIVSDENGFITAEFYFDTTTEPDAENKIKNDVNEINKTMPRYKQVQKIKVRDTEFPKTTTLKILRNYK